MDLETVLGTLGVLDGNTPWQPGQRMIEPVGLELICMEDLQGAIRDDLRGGSSVVKT